MAKWQFTRTGGPFNYPTLGFTAVAGDVLEADNAPDGWWNSVSSDTPATIFATAESSYVEQADDSVLMWDPDLNKYTPRTVSQARAALSVLSEDQTNAAYVRFLDQNGDPLPAGSVTTIFVNTVTGDIDDIVFEEAV